MIYVIGDSHVSVFSGVDRYNNDRHIQPEFGYCYTIEKGQLRSKINPFFQKLDPFCAIKVGSWTAYQSFSKLDSIAQAIKEYRVSDNDWVFLCFGEIDIRHHIGRNSEMAGISFESGIELCLKRYEQTIVNLKQKIKNMGVFGAIPSTPWVGTSTHPSYGDVDFRNRMTLLFNSKLRSICENNGVDFREINTKMLDKELCYKQSDYFMDGHHLSQQCAPIILREFSEIIQVMEVAK